MKTKKLIDKFSSIFNKKVVLAEPFFCGNEKKYLTDCIETGWVSTAGPFVDKLEASLSDYTKAKAVVVSNGTSGLHLSYYMMGIKSGDEVLVPALTFVATTNALMYLNATPHFVDCEDEQFGVNPEKLKSYLSKITKFENGQTINKNTGRPIKALVVMHAFGLVAFIKELQEVCDNFGLKLIEDAAESLGSKLGDSQTGTFGDIGVVSFNGNKIITTGGGGAVITKNEDFAKKAKHLVNQAKVAHPFEFIHDEVGFNYRMPNINAALGLAQFENLDLYIEKKRELHKKYESIFSKQDGVQLVNEREGTRSNYWLNTIILDKEFASERDEFLMACIDRGVNMRPVWRLMNKLSMYKSCPHMDLSVAEHYESRLINLPSSVFLMDHMK